MEKFSQKPVKLNPNEDFKASRVYGYQDNVLNPISGSLKIWLDSNEAASYLRISVKTLMNLSSSGTIPFYKFGRRNRYRKDELDAILLQNKRGK
jgi:excisionase family DNA binding protein